MNPKALGEKGNSADESEVRGGRGEAFGRGAGWRVKQNESFSAVVVDLVDTRNSRSVWTIATQGRTEKHYASFPDELARRMVLSGCTAGGTVLDPFAGRGTVLCVARRYGRCAIGIELLPEYCDLIRSNLAAEQPPLSLEVADVA